MQDIDIAKLHDLLVDMLHEDIGLSKKALDNIGTNENMLKLLDPLTKKIVKKAKKMEN